MTSTLIVVGTNEEMTSTPIVFETKEEMTSEWVLIDYYVLQSHFSFSFDSFHALWDACTINIEVAESSAIYFDYKCSLDIDSSKVLVPHSCVVVVQLLA